MRKERILVVDDDKDILVLVSSILEPAGYQVATVSESANAYEIIIKFAPDLIILDILMPSLDGEALLKLLKESELTRHISIMFLSAVSGPERISQILSRGAEDYLTKPIHPEILLAKVEKNLERIRHNKTVHEIVARYLGPDVAKMVMLEPGQVKVRGARKPIVCLFADIRGFSFIAETMEPESVVAMLNSILAILTDSILSLGGTIDKFIGDGVMAFWGAPLPAENMELLGVETALLMLERIRAFNQEKRFPGGLEIRLGIGISQGNAVVGNVGSEQRTDYTVIGSCINVAARLEKMAKPEQILITQEVYDRVQEKHSCQEIGEYTLKGSQSPVKVYEVIR